MQITFREIESAFGIEEKILYQWLNSKGMPAVKANDQYYFNSVEVLEWALKNRIPLTPGALKLCEKGRQGKDVVMPALQSGGIYFGIQETSKEDIFSKVLDLLPLPGHLQRPILKDMLLSREQAGTTSIGNGIAIPHVKHPVVLAGMEPMLGLFFLDHPVNFSALDGQAIHTLFVILSVSFKGHLTLLSRLAFCLQDPIVQSVLNQRNNPEDILAAFQIAETASIPN
ncbi:MAG: PTS sugar transporter subunit IIA [Candidatus Omnitrophica bacterium]|nr:PTS sugar transporter subunit IIA [Candidatus Omnitrophota bacterium]